MTGRAVLVFLGTVLAIAPRTPVAAAEMQPGLWTFAQETDAGGQVRRTSKVRCVRPAEAKDPLAYFRPRSDGRLGQCRILENSAVGGRIASRLRCAAGQSSSDLRTIITIDSPTHLVIRTTLTTSSQGKSSGVTMRGEGTRTGNCP